MSNKTSTRQQADLHANTRLAIAAGLSGGDTAAAWNAVWDLIYNADGDAKQDILAMLRDYIEVAVRSPSATREATSFFDDDAPGGKVSIDYKVDHQWHKIEFACDLEQAITRSMRYQAMTTLPSNEVRRQYQRAQQAANDKAIRDMGVRAEDGMPMWALYMTRRSKRSWG